MLGVGELQYHRGDPASTREQGDQPHRPSVNRRQSINALRDARAVKPGAKRSDARIGVGQNKNRLRAAVTLKCLGDEMCFTTPGRRSYRTPGDSQEVWLGISHCWSIAGELVTFDGQVYQALANTGVRPDDKEFWICIARAGTDAVQVTPKGEWNAVVSYELLNLVSYEGCSDLATRDNPGRPGGESG